jgi:hypothetical protein
MSWKDRAEAREEDDPECNIEADHIAAKAEQPGWRSRTKTPEDE